MYTVILTKRTYNIEWQIIDHSSSFLLAVRICSISPSYCSCVAWLNCRQRRGSLWHGSTVNDTHTPLPGFIATSTSSSSGVLSFGCIFHRSRHMWSITVSLALRQGSAIIIVDLITYVPDNKASKTLAAWLAEWALSTPVDRSHDEQVCAGRRLAFESRQCCWYRLER